PLDNPPHPSKSLVLAVSISYAVDATGDFTALLLVELPFPFAFATRRDRRNRYRGDRQRHALRPEIASRSLGIAAAGAARCGLASVLPRFSDEGGRGQDCGAHAADQRVRSRRRRRVFELERRSHPD